jgi:hypothetical protein
MKTTFNNETYKLYRNKMNKITTSPPSSSGGGVNQDE